MNQYLFTIENMCCAYHPDKVVLRVPSLQIEKGKILFLVGPSGIGKSTLIEALGLMNNTILDDAHAKVAFFAEESKEGVDLRKLWSANNERMAYFRNKHFSFIFQNTNLMQNFTAGENMCVSQLIANVPLAVAKARVLDTMEELNLDHVLFDRKVTELSGGQRQRLAFVRAITANFTVLFGDEPTGNLDKHTGFRLMRTLQKSIHGAQRSAIIVSHDLDLALEFADQIVVITPNTDDNGRTYGEIFNKNMMFKTAGQWCADDGTPILQADQYIHHCLGLFTE
jgi:ABC-type lipoprotein export system ATPase subunit